MPNTLLTTRNTHTTTTKLSNRLHNLVIESQFCRQTDSGNNGVLRPYKSSTVKTTLVNYRHFQGPVAHAKSVHIDENRDCNTILVTRAALATPHVQDEDGAYLSKGSPDPEAASVDARPDDSTSFAVDAYNVHHIVRQNMYWADMDTALLMTRQIRLATYHSP